MKPEELEWSTGAFKSLRDEMSKVLVDQDGLVQALGLALICAQHVLIEGVPGVAKTLAVRSLGKLLGLEFKRVQFTPDLLPSDLVGTQVFHPQRGDFTVKLGPIFANLVLADEINRAPAKVQSALLEAMEERQVTLGDTSHPLPDPFMVLATQNPIEQEGTYSLPEAQLDRFMFKVLVSYPNREGELQVLRLKERPAAELKPIMGQGELSRLRGMVEQVHLDPKIEEYIVDIVRATRPEGDNAGVAVRWGAGPRAVVFFLKASQALALWNGRDYVLPEDVRAVAPLILRHRILLSYEALAEGKTPDGVIAEIVSGVKEP
jgi:MoxR-like ATPase